MLQHHANVSRRGIKRGFTYYRQVYLQTACPRFLGYQTWWRFSRSAGRWTRSTPYYPPRWCARCGPQRLLWAPSAFLTRFLSVADKYRVRLKTQHRTWRQTFCLATTYWNVQTGVHSDSRHNGLCLGKLSLSHLLSAIDIYMKFLFSKGITKNVLQSPQLGSVWYTAKDPGLGVGSLTPVCRLLWT